MLNWGAFELGGKYSLCNFQRLGRPFIEFGSMIRGQSPVNGMLNSYVCQKISRLSALYWGHGNTIGLGRYRCTSIQANRQIIADSSSRTERLRTTPSSCLASIYRRQCHCYLLFWTKHVLFGFASFHWRIFQFRYICTVAKINWFVFCWSCPFLNFNVCTIYNQLSRK